MHHDADTEGRISQLERELAELRRRHGDGGWPARARRFTVMAALGLFAAGLPALAWVQGRADEQAAVAAVNAEYRMERKLQAYRHKHERNMAAVDVALAPEASDEDRTRALQLLIDTLKHSSPTRKWALAQRAALAAKSQAPASDPAPCSRRGH